MDIRCIEHKPSLNVRISHIRLMRRRGQMSVIEAIRTLLNK
jgi:hypothetical protein